VQEVAAEEEKNEGFQVEKETRDVVIFGLGGKNRLHQV
jgi:hypothetical protein